MRNSIIIVIILWSIPASANTYYYLDGDPGARIEVTRKYWLEVSLHEPMTLAYTPEFLMFCDSKGVDVIEVHDFPEALKIRITRVLS